MAKCEYATPRGDAQRLAAGNRSSSQMVTGNVTPEMFTAILHSGEVV